MSETNAASELAEWQDQLEASLGTLHGVPWRVRVYRETHSTQDIAKSFAPRPALIVADQQTAGRGRLGRSWQSAPGTAVLMSVSFPHEQQRATHDRFSLLTGVAVAECVQELLPDAPVRLKWPNDVMIDRRKLAGVLIESAQHAAIIGIGMNVCHSSAAELHGTSLQAHGRTIDRAAVIQRLMARLIHTLTVEPMDEALSAWLRFASTGQRQTFEQAGQRITGEVLDLDPDHGLIVRRDSGEIVTLPAATTSVVK
jgi:BirA family biotin operon repressor/biotin-[acetyl-CoA-carboxylase] ligase